jgi:hypothetical protein
MGRVGAKVDQDSFALTMTDGGFSAPTAIPAAGVIDAVVAPLMQRDVVYSAALNRVLLVTDSNGGQLQVLDPATLAVLRTVPLPGVPERLAVSVDGSRVYVGKQGGSVTELRGGDFSTVREFTVAAQPGQAGTSVVAMLAVDPFDPLRVLMLASSSAGSGTAVLLYRNGVLVPAVGPGPNSFDNAGWGFYYLSTVAWSSVPDEFFGASLGSPQSLYRFRVGAGAGTLTASIERVDDVGVLENGSELISPKGKIFDARSLARLRTLALADVQIGGCMRLDAVSNICELPETWSDTLLPLMVRFDNASGAVLGTYRPTGAPLLSQCPVSPSAQVSTSAGRKLTAMGDGRILMANGATAGPVRCGVQVWTLRGY